MFAGLEMRIREAEEDFLELVFLEEVWEKLHRICPNAGSILEQQRSFVLGSQSLDPFFNKFRDLCSNFHPCELY